MARLQRDIKESMTAQFIGNATIVAIYGLQAGLTFLQQFSLLSIENNLFDTVAYAIGTLETMWDDYKAEQLDLIAKNTPHTAYWYENKMLNFLFGVPVIERTDVFDTTGMTDEAISVAKVIHKAAAVKLTSSQGYGLLRIKVATLIDGTLQPLPPLQLLAANTYMKYKAADAGTLVEVTSKEADKLRLYIDVYFDSLVISSTGAYLNGSDNMPVQKAIDSALKSLLFNGKFNVQDMEGAIRAVPGIRYAKIKTASSKYGAFTYDQEGITNVGLFDMERVADSGYFVMDDLHITWKDELEITPVPNV